MARGSGPDASGVSRAFEELIRGQQRQAEAVARTTSIFERLSKSAGGAAGGIAGGVAAAGGRVAGGALDAYLQRTELRGGLESALDLGAARLDSHLPRSVREFAGGVSAQDRARQRLMGVSEEFARRGVSVDEQFLRTTGRGLLQEEQDVGAARRAASDIGSDLEGGAYTKAIDAASNVPFTIMDVMKGMWKQGSVQLRSGR